MPKQSAAKVFYTLKVLRQKDMTLQTGGLEHPVLIEIIVSPLFLNFHLIPIKLAHDIRVANIEHQFLNKIIHSKRNRFLTVRST
jgi:hypothetical protein